MDKICYRILSVSIVLTMCNIEPVMAEVNISDIIRHIVMLNDNEDTDKENIKRLTYFLEQQHEQNNTLQPTQLVTIIRAISLKETYCKTTSKITTHSCNAQSEMTITPPVPLICGIERSNNHVVIYIDDTTVFSVIPRAGPTA